MGGECCMMEGRNAYWDFVGKPEGNKPHNLLFNGYGGGVSLGVKQLEHEADHSSLSSAEVKNKHNYTSSPPCNLQCKVILEELNVNHRVKEFPSFMHPKGLLPYFQKPVTGPYSPSEKFSHTLRSSFSEIHFNIILLSTARLPNGLFPWHLPCSTTPNLLNLSQVIWLVTEWH